MPPAVDDTFTERVRSYAFDTEATYRALFQPERKRFPDGEKLLQRFTRATADVVAGRTKFCALDEAHNELCIAIAVLANVDVATLHYEPPLPDTLKMIDFRISSAGGLVTYVDVKTIAPEPTDRWDQYECARREAWFPPGEIDFAENELGGEFWHNMTVARARMLEHTLSLEEKIAKMGSAASPHRYVLAFCGDGSTWREDELEDFFYRYRFYQPDDSLASMEQHHVTQRSLRLARSVHCFAVMFRKQGTPYPRHFRWNVQPPLAK